jgi:hypothetical protein
MGDGLAQLRIWWCRIWRRRWLCLGVTWAICALGWAGVGLLTTRQTAAAAGVLLALVLLAGVLAGTVAAALVAGREPVFDSAAELQRSFRLPVLGSVADLTTGSWQRAVSHIPFALGYLGLIALCAGLFIARAPG